MQDRSLLLQVSAPQISVTGWERCTTQGHSASAYVQDNLPRSSYSRALKIWSGKRMENVDEECGCDSIGTSRSVAIPSSIAFSGSFSARAFSSSACSWKPLKITKSLSREVFSLCKDSSGSAKTGMPQNSSKPLDAAVSSCLQLSSTDVCSSLYLLLGDLSFQCFQIRPAALPSAALDGEFLTPVPLHLCRLQCSTPEKMNQKNRCEEIR